MHLDYPAILAVALAVLSIVSGITVYVSLRFERILNELRAIKCELRSIADKLTSR